MSIVQIEELFDRYQVFLIDAYGVLVTSQGALPGAGRLINELIRRKKDFYIVTNDASRLPETAAAFYQRSGLDIPSDRILTAGLAIAEAFRRHGLSSPDCAVLGTQDTRTYVERAGGTVESINDQSVFDAVVVGDDSGFDLMPTMNALLSSLNRSLAAGHRPHLLLANPDLLYPRGGGSFGFTSGSLARLLELGLGHLQPDVEARFEVLGKPSSLLYEMGVARSGRPTNEVVMIGDQLQTDILGANRAGIASCLVATGLTRWPPAYEVPIERMPLHVLTSL